MLANATARPCPVWKPHEEGSILRCASWSSGLSGPPVTGARRIYAKRPTTLAPALRILRGFLLAKIFILLVLEFRRPWAR